MQYNFCYKAIYKGKIDKVDFNCLDHEGQTFHWIDIDKLDKIKILPKLSQSGFLHSLVYCPNTYYIHFEVIFQ